MAHNYSYNSLGCEDVRINCPIRNSVVEGSYDAVIEAPRDYWARYCSCSPASEILRNRVGHLGTVRIYLRIAGATLPNPLGLVVRSGLVASFHLRHHARVSKVSHRGHVDIVCTKLSL